MPTIDAQAALKIVAFPGGFDSRNVRPLISADAAPHYEALAHGKIILPQCGVCGRVRFPVAPACPWCLSGDMDWVESAGGGQVHSWVRYHRAFLPEFEPLVPYIVLAVRLREGPILFGRSLSGTLTPQIDQPVRGVIERWSDGFCGLAFELLETVS